MASDLMRAGGFTETEIPTALAVSFLESGGYTDAVGDLHMVGKDGIPDLPSPSRQDPCGRTRLGPVDDAPRLR